MRKMVQYAGTIGTTLLLAKLGGAEVNLTDPSSSDWLKIKIGNTRYDINAGMQQNLRFLYRMGRAFKHGAMGENAAPKDRAMNILTQYIRTKLAPVPGAILNVAEGKNVIGEQTTPRREALRLVTPLMLQDMYDAWLEEGGSGVADVYEAAKKGDTGNLKTGLMGPLKTTPGVFGVGVQTYGQRGGRERSSERSARSGGR